MIGDANNHFQEKPTFKPFLTYGILLYNTKESIGGPIKITVNRLKICFSPLQNQHYAPDTLISGNVRYAWVGLGAGMNDKENLAPSWIRPRDNLSSSYTLGHFTLKLSEIYIIIMIIIIIIIIITLTLSQNAHQFCERNLRYSSDTNYKRSSIRIIRQIK